MPETRSQSATLWEGLELPNGVNEEQLKEELRYRILQRQILALEAQREIAAAGGQRFFLETGEVKLQVHPFFYHYWGQRLGYECWSDDEFIREFIRDNEEVRVKSHSRKVMVGGTRTGTGTGTRTDTDGHGLARTGDGVRFRKVYAS